MTTAVLDDAPSSRAHHLPAAGLVVLATGVTALGSVALGDAGRLVAVGLLQAGLVAAWVVATGIRGRVGSIGLGLAASAGADLAVLLPGDVELDALLAVLGLGFLAAVVHQMARPAPRLYLVASLAGVVLLLCSVCSLAVLLAVGRVTGGARALAAAVLVAGAALLVGHLVDAAWPRPAIAPGVPRGLPGLVLAVLAAVAVAVLLRDDDPLGSAVGAGVALGAGAALTAVCASFVVTERGRSSWALPVVQAVLPLAAVAPVAYTLVLHGLG